MEIIKDFLLPVIAGASAGVLLNKLNIPYWVIFLIAFLLGVFIERVRKWK